MGAWYTRRRVSESDEQHQDERGEEKRGGAGGVTADGRCLLAALFMTTSRRRLLPQEANWNVRWWPEKEASGWCGSLQVRREEEWPTMVARVF